MDVDEVWRGFERGSGGKVEKLGVDERVDGWMSDVVEARRDFGVFRESGESGMNR